jgi:lysophospholipase L1-like esterase
MRLRWSPLLLSALALQLTCNARSLASDGAGKPKPAESPARVAAPAPAPPAPPASSAPADAAPVARRSYVVAAMGDSLTDPRSHGGLYLRYLQERCPSSRFDSYGKGGEMVNQMRRRFAADVLGVPFDPGKPKYTHVIVFGGVNDLYSDLTAGRTVAKITTDLSAMYAAAHDQGLRVVALTVTPWGDFRRYYTPARGATTAELNHWILAQKDAKRVDAAVDAFPLLSCGDPERLCVRYALPFKDGLHFGPEGHKKLADALYREVFSDCR